MKSNGYQGFVCAAIAAVSFAFMSTIVKFTINLGYSPYGLLLFQFLLVTVLLWCLAVPDIRKTDLSIVRKREWVDLAIIGAFLSIMTMAYFFAVEIIPLSLAIVLFFLYPILVSVLKLVIDRKKPALYVVISLVLTFTGVLLGTSITGETMKNASVLGIILSIISAIAFALFIYYYDRPVYTLPTYLSTAVVVSAALVFIALCFPFFRINHAIDGQFLLLSLIVGVLAQLFPVLFLQLAIRRIGSVLTSIIQNVELPLTIILAFLFFKEPIQPVQVAGIILIITGIVYSNVKERTQPPVERKSV
ncbi:DMT family transporter [Neobacillus niacini]|uniref:DMT family transporter n=1 Tax=Neobacillus niacini TaxID=86668 RepID=UPI003001C800